MGININKIIATDKNLTLVLKDSRYKLDYFQREYKWERNHIAQLIDDIDSNFYMCWQSGHNTEDIESYNSYYMGPLIFYKGNEKGNPLHIIDGQQRLTSLTLLLIYLNNIQKTILPDDIQVDISAFIYSKPLGVWGFNLDVPSRLPVIEGLFKEGTTDKIEIFDDSSFNLVERFNDIIELFPSRLVHPEILPLLIFWIIRKLVFVEILADSDDNAYTIFETMNDRGLKLTSSEMLKSHLLSHIKEDEVKIKELDDLWKLKVVELHNYGSDNDDEFFKAWLRAKYAVTMRKTERGSENEDFEKIGTRFHNWVKDYSKNKIGLTSNDDYYFFVKADFRFFVDLYIKIDELSMNSDIEHCLFLQYPKRIGDSLTYPLILSAISTIDPENIINEKVSVISSFLDAFINLRLINNKAITQSSVRNYFNRLVLEFRNKNFDELKELIFIEYKKLLEDYSRDLSDYIVFNKGYGQYFFARIIKFYKPEIKFNPLLYRRRINSYVLYPILNNMDINTGINTKMLDIISVSMVNYCLVPNSEVSHLNDLSLYDRISYLIENELLENKFQLETSNDLLSFFVQRNKQLKSIILEIWKI
jgi:hypothetical protein